MTRTVKTLCFPNWLEYESFLCCAYTPLPRQGDKIRIGQPNVLDAWLVCDEEGYVRLASCELTLHLERGYQK